MTGTIVLSVSLVACGGDSGSTASSTATEASTTNGSASSMSATAATMTTVGTSGSTQGSATQGSATQSSGPTGSATGSGNTEGDTDATGGSSSNLYAEPDEIIGGACGDSPTAVSPPCSGDPLQTYCRLSDASDVIMAVCSAFGLDQCESMDDCEPGWHACNATEYIARGGRDVAPNFSVTNRAWLAACIQDLGDTRFRNEACSFCGDTEYEPVVQWWCDGEVVFEGGMGGTTLAVVAAPDCMRVGSNLPANGAYWGLDFTTGSPSHVMCCLDGA